MKQILAALIFCLFFGVCSFAQEGGAGSPATQEAIQRYMEAMHSRDTMKQTVEAMSKPMHQMVHDDIMKAKTQVPAGVEERLDKMMDDMMADLPWDELMKAIAPIYQRHFTKGDIDALIAFYAGPTGQKVLREMPEITAETMGTVMPIMRNHMDAIAQRVKEDLEKELKESEKQNNKPRVMQE